MISGKYLFDEGDVLYSKIRPYLRKAVVAPFRGLCSADIYPLSVQADVVDNQFLAWLLVSDQFTAFANRESGRARMPKLNRKQLLSWVTPLPPLKEQQRIVRIVSHGMATVERARAAAEARVDAVACLPLAFLREVFDSPTARRWPHRRVAEVGDPARGDSVQTGPFGAQLPSSEFVREGVPVLNVGSVQWGWLDLSATDHVAFERAEVLSRYRVRTGDVLFTRSGSVGRCAVVPPEADGWLVSYHLLRVAVDSQVASPEFLVAAMRGAPEVRAQVAAGAKRGATRDGVNSSFLSSLEVPFPDLSTQLRFMADLDPRLERTKLLQVAAQGELGVVRMLSNALLRRAFSGEL